MNPTSFKGFMLYAKFVSLYESRTTNLAGSAIEGQVTFLLNELA